MAFEGLSTGATAATTHRYEPSRPAGIAPRLNDAFSSEPERQRRPGGSTMGRLMRRSRTRTAGIRFEWAMRSCGPVLRVVATWTDRQGQPHHTSYSVQCNGLEGALDRAIASRISCGAPLPDREDLLQRLQQEFATSPHNTEQAAASAVAVAEDRAA
ncbi:hypothetical protein [Roseateles sp. P5_E7]